MRLQRNACESVAGTLKKNVKLTVNKQATLRVWEIVLTTRRTTCLTYIQNVTLLRIINLAHRSMLVSA